MEVPAPVEQVDKPHSLLKETAGQQAIVGEAGVARYRPVVFQHWLGLAGNIHHLRHAGLHAEGQFILGDAGGGFRMPHLRRLRFIQIPQRIQRLAAQVAVHPGRVAHIQHGIALGPALHPLEDRRDEPGAPAALSAAGLHPAADEDDKSWQVVVFRSQPVGHPRPHRRPALARRSGEEQQLGGRVVELLGEHRFDDTHLVGDRLEVGHRIRHPDASVAVLGEGARCAHQFRHSAGEGEGLALHKFVRRILAVPFHQLGFVVEDIEVRRSP